jgi:hypothetical protein
MTPRLVSASHAAHHREPARAPERPQLGHCVPCTRNDSGFLVAHCSRKPPVQSVPASGKPIDPRRLAPCRTSHGNQPPTSLNTACPDHEEEYFRGQSVRQEPRRSTSVGTALPCPFLPGIACLQDRPPLMLIHLLAIAESVTRRNSAPAGPPVPCVVNGMGRRCPPSEKGHCRIDERQPMRHADLAQSHGCEWWARDGDPTSLPPSIEAA